MRAKLFYEALRKQGFGPFVGVPCSILTPFLEMLDNRKEGFIVTSEKEAVGIAAGLYLAGNSPVVFMQNSGLANCVNPLISLLLIYKIPLLLLITLRGEPSTKDAPQHSLMGQKTEALLELLGIEYSYLPDGLKEFNKKLAYLKIRLKKREYPIALLLKRGILEKETTASPKKDKAIYELNRASAIEEIVKYLDNNCFVVTTTGKISRQYYYCKGRPDNNFYMAGSMGCASAIGLGIAMSVQKNKKTVVLDGDGALLMDMGNLATIGELKTENLIHIVLDNQCHESTGGQGTASSTVSLDKVAQNCGYLNLYTVTKKAQLKKAVQEALRTKGPSFILIKISKTPKEADNIGRIVEAPEVIKKEFMKRIRPAIKNV